MTALHSELCVTLLAGQRAGPCDFAHTHTALNLDYFDKTAAAAGVPECPTSQCSDLDAEPSTSATQTNAQNGEGDAKKRPEAGHMWHGQQACLASSYKSKFYIT